MIKKIWLLLAAALAAFLLAAPAQAQSTRAQLNATYLNPCIFANVTGLISESCVYTLHANEIQSFGTLADTNAWTGLNTFADSGSWSSSGIGNAKALGVGETAPSAGNVNIAGQYQIGGSPLNFSNLAGNVTTSQGGLYGATLNAIPYGGGGGTLPLFASPVNNALLTTNSSGVPSESIALIGSNTGPTTDGAIFSFQNGSKTALQIYQNIVPASYFYFDTLRSVVDSEATTTTNIDGFGAYTYNNVAAGSGANAKSVVGFFATQVNAIAGAKSWGANFACDDSIDNTTGHSVASTCINYEGDATAYNTGSNFEGVAEIIQGPVQPSGATAFQASQVSGATAQWVFAFVSNNGASQNAASFGATATSGNSIPSQPVFFNGFDSGGSTFAIKLQAINHTLNILDNTIADGIAINAAVTNPAILATGSDTNINLKLQPKGTGNVTATSSVIALSATATPSGGAAGSGLLLGSANVGVFWGSGAPTLSAPQGSLYIRTDGSSTSTRAYVNTNGSTGWTNLVSAS